MEFLLSPQIVQDIHLQIILVKSTLRCPFIHSSLWDPHIKSNLNILRYTITSVHLLHSCNSLEYGAPTCQSLSEVYGLDKAREEFLFEDNFIGNHHPLFSLSLFLCMWLYHRSLHSLSFALTIAR